MPAGKSAEVSFTPLNCTGVENLSNWTLYVDGAEIRPAIEGYYQVLFDADPKSVGGALPGDDFYPAE